MLTVGISLLELTVISLKTGGALVEEVRGDIVCGAYKKQYFFN